MESEIEHTFHQLPDVMSTALLFESGRMFPTEKSTNIRRMIVCISFICSEAPTVINKLAEIKCNDQGDTFFDLVQNSLSTLAHSKEIHCHAGIVQAFCTLLVTLAQKQSFTMTNSNR